jgi:hypothetical protein
MSATAFLTFFPVVAAVVSLIVQLAFLYCDWQYAEIQKTNVLPTTVLLPAIIQSDYTCLLKPHRCARYSLTAVNETFDSGGWTEILSTPTSTVSRGWTQGASRSSKFKVSTVVQSGLSERGLFNYFAAGEGLPSIFPVS